MLAVATLMTGCGKGMAGDSCVSVSNYKNMKLEIAKVDKVTNETVMDEINQGREKEKKKIPTDEAKNKSLVVFDYTGKIKGKKFKGGSAKNTELTLGEGRFVGANGKYKGFEEQIVGHKKGETFYIKVKFPDDYSAKSCAGKVATFQIKLKSVYKIKYPTLTDAWVKKNTNKKTVEEYKNSIKQRQIQDAKKQDNQNKENAVIQELSQNIVLTKIPKKLSKIEKTASIAKYKGYAKNYGIEDYKKLAASYLGVEESNLDSALKTEADNAAVLDRVCQLILEKEHKEVTSSDLKKYNKELQKEEGLTKEKELKEKYGNEYLKVNAQREKGIDYLIDHATFVTKE